MRVSWGKWAVFSDFNEFISYRIFFANGREMNFDDLMLGDGKLEWNELRDGIRTQELGQKFLWCSDPGCIERVLVKYEELRIAAGLKPDRVFVMVYMGNPPGDPPLAARLEVEW